MKTKRIFFLANQYFISNRKGPLSSPNRPDRISNLWEKLIKNFKIDVSSYLIGSTNNLTSRQCYFVIVASKRDTSYSLTWTTWWIVFLLITTTCSIPSLSRTKILIIQFKTSKVAICKIDPLLILIRCQNKKVFNKQYNCCQFLHSTFDYGYFLFKT